MPEQAAPVAITQDKDVQVVEFTNNKILDEANINEIKLALVHLIETHPKPRLLLDFGNVDHLSSAALGVLIDVNNRVRQQNGMLRMARIKPQIMEVFQITKLDKLFRIYGTREEAMHTFKE